MRLASRVPEIDESRRLTSMQEQLDALSALVMALETRLDAFYDAFYRHTHSEYAHSPYPPKNAKETLQEAERHA